MGVFLSWISSGLAFDFQTSVGPLRGPCPEVIEISTGMDSVGKDVVPSQAGVTLGWDGCDIPCALNHLTDMVDAVI